MIRKTIEVNGVCAVFTTRTNRSEMLYRRILAVIVRGSDLLKAVQVNTPMTPAQEIELAHLTAFSGVASRRESILGLDFNLPDESASDSEILQAYDDYKDGEPDIWTAFKKLLAELDKPIAPPEQRPDETLTEAERNDPNS